MEIPDTQKGQELVAAEELVYYFNKSGRGAKIIEGGGDSKRESPDFVLEADSVRFALEVTELICPNEISSRILTKAYEKLLQERIKLKINLALFPQKDYIIPQTSSSNGLRLQEDIFNYATDTISKFPESLSGLGIYGNIDYLQIWLGSETSAPSAALTDRDYEYWNQSSKLSEKWLKDYSLKNVQPILLLYRTGSFVDKDKINNAVQSINNRYGEKFLEIWCICIRPNRLSEVIKLF